MLAEIVNWYKPVVFLFNWMSIVIKLPVSSLWRVPWLLARCRQVICFFMNLFWLILHVCCFTFSIFYRAILRAAILRCWFSKSSRFFFLAHAMHSSIWMCVHICFVVTRLMHKWRHWRGSFRDKLLIFWVAMLIFRDTQCIYLSETLNMCTHLLCCHKIHKWRLQLLFLVEICRLVAAGLRTEELASRDQLLCTANWVSGSSGVHVWFFFVVDTCIVNWYIKYICCPEGQHC